VSVSDCVYHLIVCAICCAAIPDIHTFAEKVIANADPKEMTNARHINKEVQSLVVTTCCDEQERPYGVDSCLGRFNNNDFISDTSVGLTLKVVEPRNII